MTDARTIARCASVPAVREGLKDVKYLADEGIAGVVYLADRLGKPVLIEGPAGTGKTQLAKSVAEMSGSRLIRLQCYEGLDESKALYEWNYRKQLLRIQIESADAGWEEVQDDIFGSEFLLSRPLLTAISSEEPVVLLIDEIDKTDQEFEAMLLEVLSDFQISIPELGVIEATTRPIVVLTSNNSRELTEALKRRCLYLWLDYPSVERELEIVRLHSPELDEVSWTDQRDFRESLAATIAKSQEDRRIFELLFDRHFFRAAESEALERGLEDERYEGEGDRIDLDELREAIRRAITEGNDGEMRDLARLAMTAFGRQGERSGVIGVDVQRIRRALGLQARGRRDDGPEQPALDPENVRRFEQYLRRELERPTSQ